MKNDKPSLLPAPDDCTESLLRRELLLGLGMVAMAAWLPGCGGGGGSNESAGPADSLPPLAQEALDDAAAEPVPAVDKSVPRTFAHPGLLHTESDFQRMRDKLAVRAQPWTDGWNALLRSGRAQLSASAAPNPVATVIRGGDGENFRMLVEDLRRAYQFALRWKVSGDTAYADLAVKYLDAWSATLKTINGNNDKYIAAGLYGYQFANAAEIMRTYRGWSATGVARCQQMMLNVFYPVCSEFRSRWTSFSAEYAIGAWASWTLLTACGLAAIGVFCDRSDIYDEAMTYYKSGRASGSALHNVHAMHPGYLGQWQESGRDAGHCTLSIGLAGALCEMAWNQGDDLYGNLNNRVLAAAEYVAKSNLSDANGRPYDMPFVPFTNFSGSAQAVAEQDKPSLRPIWEVLYNHYVNRKGIAAPWVSAMSAKLRPETDQWMGDDPNVGTLTFSRDPVAPAKPSQLTAMIAGGRVQLSWWGSAGATGYIVKRATSLDGAYQTIATVSGLCTYTDTPGNGNWFYAITSVIKGNEVGPSNRKGVTMPGSLRMRIAFGEGSGSTAADMVVRRNATLASGAGWGEGRTSGSKALLLDGRGAHVALPADLASGLSDFTLAAWVYVNSHATDARLVDIGSDDISYMALVPRDANSRLQFTISGTSFRGEQSVAAPQLPTGRWVHVAFTLAGITGTLFVDGARVASSNTLTYAPYNIVNSSQAWVGRSQFSHPGFNGRVQDLRLYVGALGSIDIAAMAR
ncbi:LamG-like jellyroll fold domain-containing protein [Variovorax sp. AFSI2.2]|uniref:LamG-like jellyroll fold domain-containing protein n=1 Tax=Variovorax sp. AFSI2.2 TaxID=3384160 RepID=UPI003EB97F23